LQGLELAPSETWPTAPSYLGTYLITAVSFFSDQVVAFFSAIAAMRDATIRSLPRLVIDPFGKSVDGSGLAGKRFLPS
jgi:hypothetical protein